MSRSDPPQAPLSDSESEVPTSSTSADLPPRSSFGNRVFGFVGGCISSLSSSSRPSGRARGGGDDAQSSVDSPTSAARKRRLEETALSPSGFLRRSSPTSSSRATTGTRRGGNLETLGHLLRYDAPEVVYAYIGRFISGRDVMKSLGATCKGWRALLDSSSLMWWFLCGDTGKLTIMNRFHNKPKEWEKNNFFELYKVSRLLRTRRNMIYKRAHCFLCIGNCSYRSSKAVTTDTTRFQRYSTLLFPPHRASRPSPWTTPACRPP